MYDTKSCIKISRREFDKIIHEQTSPDMHVEYNTNGIVVLNKNGTPCSPEYVQFTVEDGLGIYGITDIHTSTKDNDSVFIIFDTNIKNPDEPTLYRIKMKHFTDDTVAHGIKGRDAEDALLTFVDTIMDSDMHAYFEAVPDYQL